jgi:hypothetical protein
MALELPPLSKISMHITSPGSNSATVALPILEAYQKGTCFPEHFKSIACIFGDIFISKYPVRITIYKSVSQRNKNNVTKKDNKHNNFLPNFQREL